MPEWSDKWRNPYLGMTDRVITDQAKIRWVGFYEVDGIALAEKYMKIMARRLNRSFLIFGTGNGAHIVALDLGNWNMKKHWFETWQQNGFTSDYILQRDNVLRLNRKNGKWPVFKAAFKVRSGSEIGSSYHIDLLRNRVPSRILHRLYPRLQKTYSFGLKRYISDPNGPFEGFVKRETQK